MSRPRAAAGEKHDFPFIVSTGPRPPEDPKVRQLIRKVAMKDAGLARRRNDKNIPRNNLRTQPVTRPHPSRSIETSTEPTVRKTPSTVGSTTPEGSAESLVTDATSTFDELEEYAVLAVGELPCDTRSLRFQSLAPSSSLTCAYDRVRARYGVDLVSLSLLTNFNVGRAVIGILPQNLHRFSTLLEYPQWSFLEYVPARYDSSECLSAATECVLARAAGVLSPEGGASQRALLRLYATALEKLQSAIGDPDRCRDPETLCSIQLMSLYELFDATRVAAWSHHVQGVAILFQHGQPAQFESEFAKALFAAHVGSILSECLLNNTHCYLNEPRWRRLYQSIAQETDSLTQRSPLVVGARLLMFDLPDLWHDLEEVVESDELFDDQALLALENRCRSAQAGQLGFMEEYKAYCVKTSLTAPNPTELDLRREVLGAALECLILVKRLLATVRDAERLKLETEAQALAYLIFDLQKHPSSKYSWLFTGHEVGVAHSLFATKEQWEEDLSSCPLKAQRLASRSRYSIWTKLLRAGHG